MSDPRQSQNRPFVIEEDVLDAASSARPGSPMVFATEETERVVPRERAVVAPAAPAPRRGSVWRRVGLWGIGLAIAGWLGIDAYQWIAGAFASSATLGWLASGAVAAGVAGALIIIGREVRSFVRLTSVEAIHDKLLTKTLRPAEMRHAVREVLAVVPKDRETKAAIETYQRQLQQHHTPAQQIDMLSRTVMTPLDRRAEAVVRRSTAQALGITAGSPTALTDVVFFVAMAVRMVRGVAAVYGHRPTAAATVHLLRRLVVEAGRLGVVDMASMGLTQHLGGAIAERLAASTAESLYAGQRMARIGLVTMSMCRPVPFEPGQMPGMFSSLVGNLFRRQAAGEKTAEK
jgi:putative membrane protein